MNNFRNTIKDNFTTIPNEFVNDTSLSWKAKGIFLYLASRPDDWVFSMDHIRQQATDQMGALQTGIKELEKAGYLRRQRKFNGEGKISGWKWTLELPSISRQTENPSDGKSVRRKTPLYTNTESTNTELTKTDNTNYSLREKTDWFIQLWNRCNQTSLRVTDDKCKQISSRLKTFTAQDLTLAVKYRSEDPWIQSKGQQANWNALFRSDKAVDYWLNRKPETGDPF